MIEVLCKLFTFISLSHGVISKFTSGLRSSLSAGGSVVFKAKITNIEGFNDEMYQAGYDWVGIGYDIMYGNPRGDPIFGRDLGFKKPMIVSDTR